MDTPLSVGDGIVRKLLHFNLLLWYHLVNWTQTWQEWSLDVPMQSVCFFVDQKYTKETLCMFLKGIFLRNALKNPHQKQMNNK
jgi:hypothetical protein